MILFYAAVFAGLPQRRLPRDCHVAADTPYAAACYFVAFFRFPLTPLFSWFVIRYAIVAAFRR